jgi:hypothetical protein
MWIIARSVEIRSCDHRRADERRSDQIRLTPSGDVVVDWSLYTSRRYPGNDDLIPHTAGGDCATCSPRIPGQSIPGAVIAKRSSCKGIPPSLFPRSPERGIERRGKTVLSLALEKSCIIFGVGEILRVCPGSRIHETAPSKGDRNSLIQEVYGLDSPGVIGWAWVESVKRR